MKILDDCAARVAVVSTAKGMEGIPVRPGVEIRVADDPDDLVAQIVEITAASGTRPCPDRARAWVEAMDWRRFGERRVELMDTAIAQRAR